MMKAQVLEANRRLATALGWTNIIDAGGALMGSPPWAIPHARGQMLVPNWAGDWRECGPLTVAYDVAPMESRLDQQIIGKPAAIEIYDLNAVARLHIVRSVCAKLEAAK